MPNYFRNLNYTLGDEDPTPEMEILPLHSESVLAIADCGSRIIPLLAKQPKKLVCVDINEEQLAVCELRIALLRCCSLDEYKGFLGYDSMPPGQRKDIFAKLDLSDSSREILRGMLDDIKWESMLYLGKFEQMLLKLKAVNSFFTGKAGRMLFECTNLNEQKAYYKNNFPKNRWHLVLSLLGNASVLNSLLYKGDFPKKNRSGSHFQIYKNIFRSLFEDRIARNSFFLQLLFFGEIRYKEGLPIECSSTTFLASKSSAKECEISFELGDVFEAIKKQKNLNFVSLSDVPSFLPKEDEKHFLSLLKSHLAKDAFVIVRSHLRVPMPNISGFNDVSGFYKDAAETESTQLWSFHIYKNQF